MCVYILFYLHSLQSSCPYVVNYLGLEWNPFSRLCVALKAESMCSSCTLKLNHPLCPEHGKTSKPVYLCNPSMVSGSHNTHILTHTHSTPKPLSVFSPCYCGQPLQRPAVTMGRLFLAHEIAHGYSLSLLTIFEELWGHTSGILLNMAEGSQTSGYSFINVPLKRGKEAQNH